MVVPAPDGKLNPLVLAAAKLAGVDEIYRVGGAQAVAALAYGTETIAPVAKIVGPGNAYVAAAKRLVFGKVGIDMIAGPSEVLILADSDRPSRLDRRRSAGAGRARRQRAVDPDHRRCRRSPTRSSRRSQAQLKTLPRAAIAGASLARFRRHHPGRHARRCACRWSMRSRPSISRSRARDAERLAARIRNAGAIFLGAHTPEAIGDYVGGSNHVLPTARSARFSSGLGVLDFMKRTSILKCGPEQLRALGPAAIALGEAEGLDAHARSVAMRLQSRDERAPGRDQPERPTTAAWSRSRSTRIRSAAPAATSSTSARSRSTTCSRTTAFAPTAMTSGPVRAASEHRRQPAGVRHPARRRHAGRSRICCR